MSEFKLVLDFLAERLEQKCEIDTPSTPPRERHVGIISMPVLVLAPSVKQERLRLQQDRPQLSGCSECKGGCTCGRYGLRRRRHYRNLYRRRTLSPTRSPEHEITAADAADARMRSRSFERLPQIRRMQRSSSSGDRTSSRNHIRNRNRNRNRNRSNSYDTYHKIIPGCESEH